MDTAHHPGRVHLHSHASQEQDRRRRLQITQEATNEPFDRSNTSSIRISSIRPAASPTATDPTATDPTADPATKHRTARHQTHTRTEGLAAANLSSNARASPTTAYEPAYEPGHEPGLCFPDPRLQRSHDHQGSLQTHDQTSHSQIHVRQTLPCT